MKLQVLKALSQLHPDVILDDKLIQTEQITVQTWVNGNGIASEHVRATVVIHGDEIIFEDEDVRVDMVLHCGLHVRSTDRGLGCFVGDTRISLIQTLKYTVEMLPTLTLEMLAT
jgi:hypothetical protein